MGGSAFLVENVEQLDLISFDAGKKKTGTAATADSAAIDSSAVTWFHSYNSNLIHSKFIVRSVH